MPSEPLRLLLLGSLAALCVGLSPSPPQDASKTGSSRGTLDSSGLGDSVAVFGESGLGPGTPSSRDASHQHAEGGRPKSLKQDLALTGHRVPVNEVTGPTSGYPRSFSSRPSPRPTPRPTSQSLGQPERSLPTYPEPRYKRQLDLEPQDVLALLSMWENKRRNRNWPGHHSDEYDDGDDDDQDQENLIADDDDGVDPRNGGSTWLEGPIYPRRQFSAGLDAVAPSDVGVPRTHPPNYYEEYGNRYDRLFENGRHEPPPRYEPTDVYNRRFNGYYAPQKRFGFLRKRSQGYEGYGGLDREDMRRLSELVGSRSRSGYGGYQRRFFY